MRQEPVAVRRCFRWSDPICGADGSRTHDLVPAEHALYQLSYSPGTDSILAARP